MSNLSTKMSVPSISVEGGGGVRFQQRIPGVVDTREGSELRIQKAHPLQDLAPEIAAIVERLLVKLTVLADVALLGLSAKDLLNPRGK